MTLSGADQEELNTALLSAFPTYPLFRKMLRYKLDRKLPAMAAEAGMEQVLEIVIDRADTEGWIDDLFTGALMDNPGNAALRGLVEGDTFQLAPAARDLLKKDDQAVEGLLPRATLVRDVAPLQDLVLQSITDTAAPFEDVVPWTVRLLEVAGAVCRVHLPTVPKSGTGFLVGPDLVLTCEHVLREAMQDPEVAKAAVFRFDYRLGASSAFDQWADHGLAGSDPGDWLVASSPASAADAAGGPELPGVDELDYALVRIGHRAGDDVVPGRVKRGWIRMPPAAVGLDVGAPLVILQHPETAPLKLAFATNAIESVNDNGTRVRHRVNALAGSSGAPCFSMGFDLVALHHAGATRPTVINQAVPIDAIAADLRGSVDLDAESGEI